MNDGQGSWIKARLKTHREIIWVFPQAVYWGKPSDTGLRLADEVILPFLGKTVRVRKFRNCLTEFYYEIKDTGGLIVLPNWIASFESPDLVPPAVWDRPEDERTDDIWLERSQNRLLMLEGILIIHG